MKFNKIVNGASRTFNRAGLKLKKHSPEIMVAAGIVGVVTSAVMACKATTKVGSILDEKEKRLKPIRDASIPKMMLRKTHQLCICKQVLNSLNFMVHQ